MMKKLLFFLVGVIILYAAVNHKFLIAITYLYDNDPANDSKAVALLRDAVAHDHDRKSAFLLGYYYKNERFHAIDLKRSHHFYLRAAQWGDDDAKMIVAWNFYKGIGCKRQIDKAKSFLTELAIKGNKDAEEILKFVMRY
jgi:TPR repeat protein